MGVGTLTLGFAIPSLGVLQGRAVQPRTQAALGRQRSSDMHSENSLDLSFRGKTLIGLINTYENWLQ